MRLGGRQDRTRFSSSVMRYSATRVMTAMIAMPAKTVFGSSRPWAWLMTRPIPRCEPSTSPTSAPMMAKPKAVCRLAMIQVSAEGMVTWRATCSGEAPEHLHVGHEVRVRPRGHPGRR